MTIGNHYHRVRLPGRGGCYTLLAAAARARRLGSVAPSHLSLSRAPAARHLSRWEIDRIRGRFRGKGVGKRRGAEHGCGRNSLISLVNLD
jgi:hypothetical protein